ncbi:hypothetical protein CcCBS67573_g02989 [Chytriomyces confervae]|uniref:Uncharacterized protein n=1 Tax=Chytriomyces confervae TaxID=246404 RepID=A0A507FJZ7_9FUNG|nr:hypothetical protein CcCBS67573_g02989 [Chytriomyces confervae]
MTPTAPHLTNMPTELLIQIALCLQSNEGTINGVRSLVRMTSLNVRIRHTLNAYEAPWKAHWISCFDGAPTGPHRDELLSRCCVISKLQKQSKAKSFDGHGMESICSTRTLEFLHQLILHNECKNVKLISKSVLQNLLQLEIHRIVFYGPEFTDWVPLLDVLVYCAFYEAKAVLNDDSYIKFQMRNTLRTEAFLQTGVDLLLEPHPNTIETAKALKSRLLHLCLLLKLPFNDHENATPVKPLYSFWPSGIHNLFEWNEMMSREPVTKEFWRLCMIGEWTGFYADYRLDLLPHEIENDDGQTRLCDGPMRGMQFQWTGATSAYFQADETGVPVPPVLAYNCVGGVDDWGPFEMDGRVIPSTLAVYMRKRYLTGRRLSWELEGRLNEFGIVGGWGDASGTFFMYRCL